MVIENECLVLKCKNDERYVSVNVIHPTSVNMLGKLITQGYIVEEECHALLLELYRQGHIEIAKELSKLVMDSRCMQDVDVQLLITYFYVGLMVLGHLGGKDEDFESRAEEIKRLIQFLTDKKFHNQNNNDFATAFLLYASIVVHLKSSEKSQIEIMKLAYNATNILGAKEESRALYLFVKFLTSLIEANSSKSSNESIIESNKNKTKLNRNVILAFSEFLLESPETINNSFYIWMGKILIQEGAYSTASTLLFDALRHSEDDVSLFVACISANIHKFSSKTHAQSAISLLHKCISYCEKNSYAIPLSLSLCLSEIYISFGHFTEAANVLNCAFPNPKSVARLSNEMISKVFLLKGQLLQAEGKFSNANDFYLRSNPTPLVTILKAQCHIGMGGPEAAISMIRALIEKDNYTCASNSHHLVLGIAYHCLAVNKGGEKTKEGEEALHQVLKNLEHYLSANDQNVQACLLYVNTLLALQLPKWITRAIDCLRKIQWSFTIEQNDTAVTRKRPMKGPQDTGRKKARLEYDAEGKSEEMEENQDELMVNDNTNANSDSFEMYLNTLRSSDKLHEELEELFDYVVIQNTIGVLMMMSGGTQPDNLQRGLKCIDNAANRAEQTLITIEDMSEFVEMKHKFQALLVTCIFNRALGNNRNDNMRESQKDIRILREKYPNYEDGLVLSLLSTLYLGDFSALSNIKVNMKTSRVSALILESLRYSASTQGQFLNESNGVLSELDKRKRMSTEQGRIDAASLLSLRLPVALAEKYYIDSKHTNEPQEKKRLIHSCKGIVVHAMKTNPHNAAAMNCLAVLLAEGGSFDEAIMIWREILEEPSPICANVHTNIAALLACQLAQKRSDHHTHDPTRTDSIRKTQVLKIEHHCKQSLEIRPFHRPTMLLLAKVQKTNGDWEAALGTLREGLRRYPWDIRFSYNSALVRLSECESNIEYIKKINAPNKNELLHKYQEKVRVIFSQLSEFADLVKDNSTHMEKIVPCLTLEGGEGPKDWKEAIAALPNYEQIEKLVDKTSMLLSTIQLSLHQ